MSQCDAYGELDRMRTVQNTSDITGGTDINATGTNTVTYETIPVVL